MGTRQNQQSQFDHGLSRTMKLPAVKLPVAHEERENRDVKEVIPGVLIVRSNTPRPHSFEPKIPPEGQSQSGQPSESMPLPTFPSKAPSAPPLPEELSEEDEELPATVVPLSSSEGLKSVAEEQQEFIWLFEYGLEMDATILNSPERLDGLALLYGPAVLKGYSMMFATPRKLGGRSAADKTIVTMVPRSEADAEVWGVLYRIPRRITEGNEREPSLLDTIHDASPDDGLFKRVQVTVHEAYRSREITCVTYLISDAMRQRLRLFSLQQGGDQTLLAQRLAAIARKQRLPEKYLSIDTPATPLPVYPGAASDAGVAQSLRGMPDTEPLPVVKEKKSEQPVETTTTQRPAPSSTNRWLIVFALYLAVVLLAVLTVAVLQDFGSSDLTTSFKPLGVPILVLVYGLLGGCVSSIVTLGRYRIADPPLYVVITWFTRPYIGSVLATLTYLLFTSGFFIINDDSMRHHTLFLFVGALAGLCEGWLFFRSSNPSSGSR